jgi:hypothetical protein
MTLQRAWLAPYSWEFVTAQNALLCSAKNALHKPTSDGYESTKTMWESAHQLEMPLDEAVDLCRRCHRAAPFCFYNGNTFAAIIRDVVMSIPFSPDLTILARSLAGHIVAGVATEEEVRAFHNLCSKLDA